MKNFKLESHVVKQLQTHALSLEHNSSVEAQPLQNTPKFPGKTYSQAAIYKTNKSKTEDR